MKFSVLLCSYNGERFIEEQLTSIVEQTVKVDEIIIVDDASKDGTVEIVEDFIKGHPSWNIRLYRNHHNVGWRANFKEGLKYIEGGGNSIIFFSDQDDIWLHDRVEITQKIMENDDGKVLCLEGKWIVVDEYGKILRLKYSGTAKNALRYWQKRDSVRKVKNRKYIRGGYMHGSLICFRSVLIPWVNRVVDDNTGHDTTVAAIAYFLGGLYVVNRNIIKYRVHGDNNSVSFDNVFVSASKHLIDVRIDSIEKNLKWCETLYRAIQEHPVLNSGKFLKDTATEIELCEKRIDYLRQKNIVKVFGLVRFLKYYKFRTWQNDVFHILKSRFRDVA
jgi:glycosyltransferase involved in cell wall biosynthesis